VSPCLLSLYSQARAVLPQFVDRIGNIRSLHRSGLSNRKQEEINPEEIVILNNLVLNDLKSVRNNNKILL